MLNWKYNHIYIGIIPIANKKWILRIAQFCEAKISSKFVKILEKYENIIMPYF